MRSMGPNLSRAVKASLVAVALAATLGMSATASAAQTNGAAESVVVRPMTLVKTDDLEFGSLIIGTTSGTLTINAATNARSATGGVTLVGSGHRATFQGAASVGAVVVITGSNTATLARAGGLAAPLLANLTRTAGSGVTTLTIPLIGTVTIVSTGVQTYYVGGTLNVPPNQMEGDYSGTFTLTVNYL